MAGNLVDATTIFARYPHPRMIATRGGPVECVVFGDGPAVLVVHGGIGGFDQGLRVAAAALGDLRHTVIAVSRPGYLGTPLSAGATPAEQADLFADILDAVGIDQAIVMAISAGGPSAIEFALRHRARCRALVLVSACTGRLVVRLGARIQMLRLLSRWPSLVVWFLRRLARDPERMAGWLIGNARARDAIRDNAQSRAALIELLGDILDQLGPRMRGTEHDLRLLGRIADYPLEQIAVPVLALHGTDDDIVAFSHAEAVAIRVPDARVIGVAGGEHVCLFTHRDFVRAEVARFFIEHMPSRAPLAARPGRARNR